MTVKASEHGGGYEEVLSYLADCVIHLDQRVSEQITTRRLRVVKYRGSPYGRNEYPFLIADNGVHIMPVTHASLKHCAVTGHLPTGVAGLDALLGGGYQRASCILVAGSSGSGKTTFACSLAEAATAAGDRVLYVNFEESWDAMASCMLSPGIDLYPAASNGRLRFDSAMPESQGVEEHLYRILRTLGTFDPAVVVVDAISACRRMGSPQAAFDFLLRLVDHTKAAGITTLFTNLTERQAGAWSVTGVDLSSVIDTVILLRNREVGRVYRRDLVILKSRGHDHSRRAHEFSITRHGVVIAPTAKEAARG